LEVAEEKIIKVVRRHFFVILPMVLAVLFGAFVPLVLYRFIISGYIPLDPNLVNAVNVFVSEWEVFGYALWLLLLWIVFFMEWTDYYLDLWLITDKRIIDVEQKGFFHREVTSFHYAQIQDITVETHGPIQTLLKFGTLHIETAGESREILIKNAHYPEEARALILSLQEKIRNSHNSL